MNKNRFIFTLIIFITASLITSCSGRYVSTNFNKENFSDYFSASKVKIFEQEKDIKSRHNYIGMVEGQDCQIKPHHAVPDKVNARSEARRHAFEQQANAVIFTGCTLLTPEKLAKLKSSSDAQQCHAIVICYAKAFAVELPTEQ
jgi:RcsF protein